MSTAMSVDVSGLLQELAELPASCRLAHLRAEGNTESLLFALSEEIDRLAAVEVARALEASELILTLAHEAESPRAQGEAHAARAMVLAYAGRFEESLANCAAAIAETEPRGLLVEAARARLASVHPLARLGRFTEAIETGNAARQALLDAGEPVLAARADVSLGAVHDMREDPAEALRHYDRALSVLVDDPTIVAQIETNRAIALIGLDQFVEAEEAFQNAVTVFEQDGSGWAAAVAEGNLAYLATRQGRLERALHHFERARRALETDEAPADLARLLTEQAAALSSLGMPAEALEIYAHALPGLERHGLAAEIAQARSGIGRAQLQSGFLLEAELTLAAAAGELDALGQERARAVLDLTRAELAERLGNVDEARWLINEALPSFPPESVDSAVAGEILARLDLAAGDVQSAATHIAAALPIAERLDLAPLRARLLHLRGMSRRGIEGGSLSDLLAAVAQVERLRGALPAERFRVAFLGSQLSIYEDAVLAALDGGEATLAEAFALVERAKGRALLDLVEGALDLAADGESYPDNASDAALVTELARIRNELNWHYSRFDRPPEDASIEVDTDAWQATIARLEAEFDALEDRLAAARGVAALFAPPVGLLDTLAALPAGTALLEYFIAGDEVVAFVLRDGMATVRRRLTTRGELEHRLQRIRFQISRAIASAGRELDRARAGRFVADVQRELGAVYDLLLAPLESALAGADRLRVVPHGPIHMLPLHALWDGERYLIERFEIACAPSASVLAHLGAARAAAPEGAAALVFGAADALAPRIEAEAENVASVLGVLPFLNEEATAARLNALAHNAGIIHLAAHGRFVPDRPLASGMKLGDRWLTVRDIYALRLRAALVTLSGCDTGRATVTNGDELLGLMRGFFAAGARSLLISLWVVNDESTAELMAAFYSAYRQGQPTAAALRNAQLALLARRPHPAFWAPFFAGGDA